MRETLARLDGRAANRVSQGVEGSRRDQESDPASLLLAAYYRCSVNQGPFRAVGDLARNPGDFRLGPDTICYGQLSSGCAAPSLAGELFDALNSVELDAQGIALPFDAGILVENLCRERYTANFRQEGRVLNEILRKAYYLIRPLLGVAARRQIRASWAV